MITSTSLDRHGFILELLLGRDQEHIEPNLQKRILFVHKEEMLVAMYLERLSRMGYRPVGNTSALAALDIFRAAPHDFDLAIIDYELFATTGIALAKDMLSIRSDIPVILLSDFDEMVTPETVKAAGIRAYASKVASRQEMQGLIEQILQGRTVSLPAIPFGNL